ncbi:MAG TPA: hypothetical protein VK674_05495 [Candidatus Limnocylindria bacterium]|nr:hypothetical protein [Candidatus Limnocylindria bacterium]
MIFRAKLIPARTLPGRLVLWGAPLLFLGFASGATMLSALPYGSGAYDTCTYDTCGISVLTSGTVTLAVTPTSGGVNTTAEDEVIVETDASTGYTLTFLDSDTDTALTSGANTVTASGGTQASPVTLALNTWGYRVDSLASFGAGPTGAQNSDPNALYTFAGVPASNQTAHTLKSTSSAANPAEVTEVWFGARLDTAKPDGIYTGQVTYTAVTND